MLTLNRKLRNYKLKNKQVKIVFKIKKKENSKNINWTKLQSINRK